MHKIEYAPADERAFDAMVAELRRTPEWKFVDREVDIRLVLAPLAEPFSPAALP